MTSCRFDRLSRYTSALFIGLLLSGPIHGPTAFAGDRDVAGSPRPTAVMRTAVVATGTTSPRSQAELIERQPRFVHTITGDCTIRCVAQRLHIPVARLLAYNSSINEAESPLVPEGARVVVPIAFPLLNDLAPLKVDVSEHRFVAAYGGNVPFAAVSQLADWYREQLSAYGFELIEDRNNDSLRFSGGLIARGTVEFSPGDDEYPVLIDIALVVRDDFGAIDATCGDG